MFPFDTFEMEEVLIKQAFSVDDLGMEVVDRRAAALRVVPDSEWKEVYFCAGNIPLSLMTD